MPWVYPVSHVFNHDLDRCDIPSGNILVSGCSSEWLTLSGCSGSSSGAGGRDRMVFFRRFRMTDWYTLEANRSPSKPKTIESLDRLSV